jgi:hypothetical protein
MDRALGPVASAIKLAASACSLPSIRPLRIHPFSCHRALVMRHPRRTVTPAASAEPRSHSSKLARSSTSPLPACQNARLRPSSSSEPHAEKKVSRGRYVECGRERSQTPSSKRRVLGPQVSPSGGLGLRLRSTSRTLCPRRASCRAQMLPAGPPPITTIGGLKPVLPLKGRVAFDLEEDLVRPLLHDEAEPARPFYQ